METVTFDTPTATCSSCRATIRETLSEINGIAEAEADLRSRQTTVTFDPAVIDETSIGQALVDAGYPPQA